MKSVRLVIIVAVTALVARGQLANQQLTWDSIVGLSHGGVVITFPAWQGREMFNGLWNTLADPKLARNAYLPPYLKEKLGSLREHAVMLPTPTFPAGWHIGHVENINQGAIATARYCTETTFSTAKPCIVVYTTMLMIVLRLHYRLSAPDAAFKNSFAVHMGHEGIHFEVGPAVLGRQPLLHPLLFQEERRAWYKTVNEIIRPLRRAGQPLGPEFEDLENSLAGCRYRLPCAKFDQAVEKRIPRSE